MSRSSTRSEMMAPKARGTLLGGRQAAAFIELVDLDGLT
jgi:hypothetical protein